MSVSQQCCRQTPPANSKPAFDDGPLDQGLLLETLNLHATAISTALRRQLALEAQLKELRAQPSAPPAASTPVAGKAGFFPARFDVVHQAPVLMTMTERVLLYGLVAGLRPLRCLEIGTHKGGSAMIITAALDDIGVGRLACVDPNPVVKPEHWQTIAHRVTLQQGCSPDILPAASQAVGGKFHFALIDGDHSTAGVVRDIKGVLAYLEDDAYLLFHDAHNREVVAGINAARNDAGDCLVNCGMISTEKTVDLEHDALWGGLQLLRFSRRG
ncbi:MAG TPA: class I SAM-dependent methyltransferase [Terriglobia bacterium]|nr:class I SAM-dependent methyltransferase [Terriglobia bacterium]